MNYPIYKKKGKCYTAIYSEKNYIQIHWVVDLVKLIAGQNQQVIKDVIEWDDPITGKEFCEALYSANEFLLSHVSALETIVINKLKQADAHIPS